MKRICLILAMCLFLPLQVFASDGFYAKGTVGIFMLEDSDIDFTNEVGTYDVGSVSAHDGFGLSAAIGHSFSSGFDVELEYSYRETELDKLSGKSFSDTFGETEITFLQDDRDYGDSDQVFLKTLMANAIYNVKNNSIFTPYAGGGIGLGWLELEDGEFNNTKFAYQLLAGVDAAVSKNVSVLVGYRYLGMGDISRVFQSSGHIIGPEDFAKQLPDKIYSVGEAETSLDSHSIEVGLKYSF